MINQIHITGVQATFDGMAILLIVLGILTRLLMEYYKNSQIDGIQNINWRQQIASSIIALLIYVVITLLAEVKIDLFEAFIFGFMPQTVINEFNARAAAKKGISITPKE